MSSKAARNEGIIVRDEAKIEATQLIAGRHSSGVVYSDASQGKAAKVEEKLNDLLDAVSRERSRVDDLEQIERHARFVANEALSKTPNRVTISGVLDGICSAVKSATGAAVAMEAFKAAIMSLIG